jgi:glycosyltransferase involved in cell wall biosynthesis
MTSVIVPAFNEAAVIGRTLESLLASIGQRDTEVVVVCNACSDNTAEVARAVSPWIRVIETPQPGKCAAINLGEQHVRSFPRIYLDADVSVSESLVPDLEAALACEGVCAAWPKVCYDLTHSSGWVAAFYRVWTALPYNQPGRIGVGVYALSEQGRSQFSEFPPVISDDGFIRGLFGPAQRVVVDTCQTIVRAPRDLRSLLAVKTRSRLGVYELWHTQPRVMRGHSAKRELTWHDYTRCLRPPILLSLPVYAFVVAFTKLSARRRLRGDRARLNWDRDLTQRFVS